MSLGLVTPVCPHLINQYDQILHPLETGVHLDVIYLDFGKAFDTVDHGLLLHKIHELGISSKIGILLHSLMTDREQWTAAKRNFDPAIQCHKSRF